MHSGAVSVGDWACKASSPSDSSQECCVQMKRGPTFCVAGTRNVGTLTCPPARWSSCAAAMKSSVLPPVHDLQDEEHVFAKRWHTSARKGVRRPFKDTELGQEKIHPM